MRCASTARSSYYVIAANAAAAMLVFQASLNILGAVDVLPLTGVTLPFVSMGGSSMISCWALLAYIKAADTRPNASFTLKLPKRIRSWIPVDNAQEYAIDDDYYGDEYDGYGYEEEEYYEGGEYDQYDGYDAFDAPPPRREGDWQIEDSLNSRRDPGAWEDLLSGPLWGDEPPPDRPPRDRRERRRRR